MGCRQQSDLYTSGKTARIGHVLSLLDFFLVDFWQTIDVVVIALDAEILCEIDNLYVLGNGMFLQECLAFAVAEAEEYHVNLVERHFVGKLQVSLANQSFVHVANRIASVAL